MKVKYRADEISRRWEPLFGRVQKYLHAGDLLRHRKLYRQGVDKLESWIIEANHLLTAVPVATLQVMQIVTIVLIIYSFFLIKHTHVNLFIHFLNVKIH